MADDSKKQIERAEYRTKLIEAELNAIRGSKSYRVSKKLGIIKSQIQSDPVGLTKKAAKMILTNPKKARHMLRSANHNAIITQSVAEQAAKYQEWILLNEPDEEELDIQRSEADKLAYRPLISIVTPVFNPPLDVFEELIESVLEQTYTNFELCLGNFGNDKEVDDMIVRYAKLDPRIKHYSFTENLGIAGNSNQILKKVSGEFIALLDHDDTLSPDALYENAKLLNKKDYDFIYSDKDKIDDKGHRFDPLFKPELSPEMLLNINYLTHLNVMRTNLVKQIGGWDSNTDGAQDWDLFLRIVDKAKHIGFIPKVLYHWRVIATSTAMSIETKPYALANQCKTIDKHLKGKGVDATAYIDRTELFIKWGAKSLDMSPVVFIYYTNMTNTNRMLRRLRKVLANPIFVLLVDDELSVETKLPNDQEELRSVHYKGDNLIGELVNFLKQESRLASKVAVFIPDSVRLAAEDTWYERLTGWLALPGVSAASGRLINKYDLIVNSGGIIQNNGIYHPLFSGCPRYYQSYIGNSEWVRNLSVLSPYFFSTKIELLITFSKSTTNASLEDYFIWLTSKGDRLVMAPHATAMVTTQFGVDEQYEIESKRDFIDPYGSVNTCKSDPLRLFETEELAGLSREATDPQPIDGYQHDAIILADTFDITYEQLAENKPMSVLTSKPNSIAWILPSFDAIYAGLMNIFSFANYLSEDRGMKTTVYILTGADSVENEKQAILNAFPEWSSIKVVGIQPNEIDKIAKHDIGIATQWATTYPLAKTSSIGNKYYFIQDNEANFYPKGSISALVELSYTFGFQAIAGTRGLLDMYEKSYGGKGIVLGSKVDLTAYHPRKDLHYTPKPVYKVFFYARPNMPRNAFELGIAGLKRLKQEFGSSVEVITAGASWDASSYGVEGMFINLGKVDYDAVPKLYRSVDAGLMFMFSGHPGVTASELMASGCPVVVNEYDDITWQELYQNEETCLITKATASEVCRNLKRCLLEPKLRRKLIDNGLQKSNDFYSGYEESCSQAADSLLRKSS